MTLEWMKYIALGLGIVLGLSSCGNSTVAEGGIGGTGISMGSVTAVGSIWVNGVEYDTTGAHIVKSDDGTDVMDADGTAGGNSILPGMVVTVEGSINANGVSGSATRVSYSDTLQGQIDDIPDASRLVVLGQTVIIDNLTKDETNSVISGTSGFIVGDNVKVSGFTDAQGQLRATYIQKTTDTTLRIKGVVESVISKDRFTLNGLIVDTSYIGVDVSSYAGKYVEVKGDPYLTGVITASRVSVRASMLGEVSYDEAELEGIVTTVDASGNVFYINGQQIVIDAGASFNGGVLTDIVPGVRVEVEGSIANGIFTATQIHFEDDIELEGDVASVDSTAGTVTLVGMPTLPITVDNVVTEFSGDDPQFGAIQTGHHLIVRCRDTDISAGISLFAIRIESSISSSVDIMLQGPLEVESPPTVQVLGMSIDTTGMSYEIDTATSSVDQTTFFNTANVDDLVSLTGTWDGSNINWNSIELDQ